jgi:hypothetical protein
MPSKLFDPEHWRSRAEEARALARQMSDPRASKMLLDIAEDYDQLAEQRGRLARRARQSKR